MDPHPTKACLGADTRSERNGSEHGQVCQKCGTWVRDDAVDDPFWGFKAGCLQAEEKKL